MSQALSSGQPLHTQANDSAMADNTPNAINVDPSEVEKFNKYVVDSRKKANVLQNSFQKASAAIDMDASSDKKALTTLSRSSQNSVLI